MGLFSEQDLATLAQTPPEPVPLPFWEGVGAVLESGRLTDQSLSTNYQTGEALRGAFDAMRDHGLGAFDLGWPITDATAKAAFAYLDSRKDDIVSARGFAQGPPDLRLQTGDDIRASVQERTAAAQAEAERAGLGAQIAGGLAVGLTDPANLAAIPFGAAAGEGLLVKALTEAGLGMASQAAVETASLGAKERAGVEPSLADSAANVALTGVLGAGLAGVFHGAGLALRRTGIVNAYRKAVSEGRIAPTRALDDAADAVEDAAEVVRPLSSPEAEASHLSAVAAAADVLQAADTPEAQMAAAARFAQAAADAPERAGPSDNFGPEISEVDRSKVDAQVQAAQVLDPTREKLGEIFPPNSPNPPARLTDDVEEAAFVAATEADPDLPASYFDANGKEHAGRARDLVADLDDEGTTLRGILDCVLAGGPKEPA